MVLLQDHKRRHWWAVLHHSNGRLLIVIVVVRIPAIWRFCTACSAVQILFCNTVTRPVLLLPEVSLQAAGELLHWRPHEHAPFGRPPPELVRGLQLGAGCDRCVGAGEGDLQHHRPAPQTAGAASLTGSLLDSMHVICQRSL